MQSNLMIIVSQLAAMSPILLIYMVGLVLALLNWRRAPMPMMLAISGLLVLLLGTIASTSSQVYFINSRRTMSAASMAQRMTVIAISFNLLRAIGMGLVLGGLFARRTGREDLPAFSVGTAPPPPPHAHYAQWAPGRSI